MSDSPQPHGLQPTRLLRPWDFPGKSTGVGCHCLLCQKAVLGCNFKNDRMISVPFQGKPFNITVIQVYVPRRNAEEAEQFYEDLQDVIELTPKKDVLFITGDWNAKVESQEIPGVTGKFGLEDKMKQGKN